MKYVYEALGEVRKRIVMDSQSYLSRGKRRSEEDRKLPVQIKRLRRVSHAITQSMLSKYETHIIYYFRHGATNAETEWLNGKIQRFITKNYGLKDKDFFLYRTTGYFS
jgi:hypothetical protein